MFLIFLSAYNYSTIMHPDQSKLQNVLEIASKGVPEWDEWKGTTLAPVKNALIARAVRGPTPIPTLTDTVALTLAASYGSRLSLFELLIYDYWSDHIFPIAASRCYFG